MCGTGEKMLAEVAFLFFGRALACLHTNDAFAATSLCTKRAHGRAFNKAPMRDADDAALVRDEVFHIDLCFVRNDFRQARRTIFVADFAQFLFDDREDALLFGQNIAKVLDRLDYVLVLRLDLLPLESGELIQTQVENLVGLLFAERVTAFHQPGRTTNDDPDLLDLSFGELECEKFYSRLVAIGRFADDSDEFVEIFQRNQITLQGFSA